MNSIQDRIEQMDLSLLTEDIELDEKIELFKNLYSIVLDKTFFKLVQKYIAPKDYYLILYNCIELNEIDKIPIDILKDFLIRIDADEVDKFVIFCLQSFKKREGSIMSIYKINTSFEYSVEELSKADLLTPDILDYISTYNYFFIVKKSYLESPNNLEYFLYDCETISKDNYVEILYDILFHTLKNQYFFIDWNKIEKQIQKKKSTPLEYATSINTIKRLLKNHSIPIAIRKILKTWI